MGRALPRQVRVIVLLVTLVVPTQLAFAQNPTFNVEGVVTDAQQAVLPGVVVTVTNTATGLTRTVTTTESGRYVVRALPPEGQYQVQVEIAGFATQLRQNLVFNAGQNAVLNFAMQLATVQETVTVAGDAPLVQTTSSEVSTTIDRQAFELLPGSGGPAPRGWGIRHGAGGQSGDISVSARMPNRRER